jgi:hypothetical protein
VRLKEDGAWTPPEQDTQAPSWRPLLEAHPVDGVAAGRRLGDDGVAVGQGEDTAGCAQVDRRARPVQQDDGVQGGVSVFGVVHQDVALVGVQQQARGDLLFGHSEVTVADAERREAWIPPGSKELLAKVVVPVIQSASLSGAIAPISGS